MNRDCDICAMRPAADFSVIVSGHPLMGRDVHLAKLNLCPKCADEFYSALILFSSCLSNVHQGVNHEWVRWALNHIVPRARPT